MNLIAHQFKTDVRHFRWQLAGFWLWLALEMAVMNSSVGTAEEQTVFLMVAAVGQLFSGVLLIAASVQADPLVGTSAAWLTRPIRRRHLFWAKSMFILLLVLLPKIAAESVAWIAHGYSFHLWLCAAGQSLLFSGTFALLAAALAALTRDFAWFFLAVGLAVLAVFIGASGTEMLDHAGVIVRISPPWNEQPSFQASADTASVLACVAGSLAAWIAQGRFRRLALGAVCVAAGLMAGPFVGMVWHHDFLQPRPTQAAPLSVSARTEIPGIDGPGQKLAHELTVNGVPPQNLAVVRSYNVFLAFDHDRTVLPSQQYYSSDENSWPAHSRQSDNYFHAIERTFPAQTLCFNDNGNDPDWSFFTTIQNKEAVTQFNGHPPRGSLYGDVVLDLFEARKVAEAPLRAAAFNVLPGLRVTVRSVKLIGGVITASITESAASLMWDRDMQTANSSRGLVCTYVLYHPPSGEAMILYQNESPNRLQMPWNEETKVSLTLRFPYPDLRERLEGVTAAQWMQEARLCVFAPVYAGTTKCKFHQDGYQWTIPEYFK